jgi:hypothetical protein
MKVYTVRYDNLRDAVSIEYTDEFLTKDAETHIKVAQASLALFQKMNKLLANAVNKEAEKEASKLVTSLIQRI